MLKKRSSNHQPISEINVTPFVDVLLVLLIIFMITAPLFTKVIDVKLPKENLRSSSTKEIRQFVITIKENGDFFINGTQQNEKKLVQAALAWKEKNEDETAFIKADERVKYGKITSLMVLLRNNGIQKLGLLVEQKPELP